jgi:hypothetical protein
LVGGCVDLGKRRIRGMKTLDWRDSSFRKLSFVQEEKVGRDSSFTIPARCCIMLRFIVSDLGDGCFMLATLAMIE